ncbi:MAG: S1 RNA-binding domain-containing protein [Anaerolineae bacterium]|nr:S1 RNA-binding domain-containing protein [Anaerolineae bacterium]
MVSSTVSTDESQLDFATLLERSFEDLESVSRGDILTGTILAVDDYGVIVDVGLKRDGVVPRSDVEAMGEAFQYKVGQCVSVMVIRAEDRDGNLVVSLHQAAACKDWDAARELMDSDQMFSGTVVAVNRGGLIVPFGELRGFVPSSHISDLPRGDTDDERLDALRQFVGQELMLKVIEVNPRRRRLVLSQRLAFSDVQEAAKDRLLETLNVGDVVQGRVSSLRDFGAFVDIGGADGLIHVSELAWSRIDSPGEIVRVGEQVEASVIQVDRNKKRIGLSLKRLQPNPWEEIEENLEIGQLVEGTITRVVSFGAFVELDRGIEALLHVSEMGELSLGEDDGNVSIGDRIRARIITLDPRRHRMGLSIKDMAAGASG